MFFLADTRKDDLVRPSNGDSLLHQEFNTVYPFTNENIAGYMKDLDLTNKKIITVAGSGDHVINAISRGATDITVFDINPLAKYYLDLRIAAIKNLSYHNYVHTFLYRDNNMDSSQIESFDMPEDSMKFWIEKLYLRNGGWLSLRKSSMFNQEFIDPKLVYLCNLYFDEYVYEEIKKRLDNTSIIFHNTNLKNLELKQQYDYMFLSNISDYSNLMYDSNPTENYAYLMQEFLKYVQTIYMSYLFGITEDDLNVYQEDLIMFSQILGGIKLEMFDTSLFIDAKNPTKDGVFVITRK